MSSDMTVPGRGWNPRRIISGPGAAVFHFLDRALPHRPLFDHGINRLRYWRAHGRMPRPSAHPQATFNDLVFERMARDDWTPLERAAIDKQHAKLLAQALCPAVRTAATRAVFEVTGPGDTGWLAARLAARRGRSEVAKSTHGSGSVLFLRDGPSDAAIAAFCDKATRSFYAISRESQYRRQERKIILEEDLSEAGVAPTDYKFFCVGGEVLFAQVDVGRFRHHLRSLVTPGFEPIDVRYAHDAPEEPPVKPLHFDRMREMAAELSRPFGFVRIDLYAVGGDVYFGEFTFAPEGGSGALSREDFGVAIMQRIRQHQEEGHDDATA